MILENTPNACLGLRLARLGLLTLAALFALGCVGSTEPVTLMPEAGVPASWTELDASEPGGPSGVVEPAPVSPSTPDAAQIAAWWRQLGDPVLDRLVESALDGNLDLRTAASRVDEARARRGLSKADFGPSISAGLDARTNEPLGDGFSFENYGASVTASWEADLFGAKRSALDASDADLAASIEQLYAAQVSLVAEVVVAYADLRVAERRLVVIDQSLESRDETYELTDFREQASLTSRLELNQALSSREQARASRAIIEQSATVAKLRLALLAGETPGALDELLETADPAQDPVPTLPEQIAVGVPAQALERRPDVRAAAHRVDAALARLGVAQAQRYPTLRLTGSLDGQSPDVSDLFDADAFFANLLAGLTAPIFESGRIEQNIEVERARLEQETLAYRDQVLVALSEVESALASLRHVGRQIDALDGAIVAAREAAELADQRYAAGLVDLLVVLDTERTLLSLEEQRVSARGERVVAFSNLYRALGGGWQTDAAGSFHQAQSSKAQSSKAQSSKASSQGENHA